MIELETTTTRELRRELEDEVERMLRQRPGSNPPAARPPKEPESGLPATEYLVGGSILLALSLAGAWLVWSGMAGLHRWRHAPHFVAVEANVVGVQLVTRQDSWGDDGRFGATLVPEIQVAYELHGPRTSSFRDETLRRQTAAIAKSIAETTWMGRTVPMFVDPDAPGAAVREVPKASWTTGWRVVAGLLAILPALVLTGGAIAERLKQWRALLSKQA